MGQLLDYYMQRVEPLQLELQAILHRTRTVYPKLEDQSTRTKTIVVKNDYEPGYTIYFFDDEEVDEDSHEF